MVESLSTVFFPAWLLAFTKKDPCVTRVNHWQPIYSLTINIFIFCEFQNNRWDTMFFPRDVNEMVMICLQDQQRLLSNEVRNTCREIFSSRLFEDLFHVVFS